ncbi:MAG: hypothetical protein IGS54_14400 [Elainella sp. C42_A2020_010]|nr:hypothetical protein [Elainella sp. C42_A2020_010]
MNWTSNLEEFLKQLSEIQRGVFTSMSTTIPSMQSGNIPNFQEALDNTLKLQEEIVTSSLELQALLARLTIENQKQLWDNYFNLFRKK